MDMPRLPITDWQEFQKSIMKELPFGPTDYNSKGIENFVQKILKNVLPSNMAELPNVFASTNKSIDYDLFDTQRSTFITCRVPGDTSPRDIKFFANKRTVKINIAGNTEEIILPHDIIPSRASAKLHNHTLEIRMPKVRDSEPLQEIFIQEQ